MQAQGECKKRKTEAQKPAGERVAGMPRWKSVEPRTGFEQRKSVVNWRHGIQCIRMADKIRIDFAEGKQSFTCDAPLHTQFREFLESRGIFTRSPEPWESAGTVDTVYIEISEQSKSISGAEGEALIGEFLKSQGEV